MSRRDVINNIETLNRRIREHEEKIRRNPGDRTIPHWESEIRAFKKERDKYSDRKNGVTKAFNHYA